MPYEWGVALSEYFYFSVYEVAVGERVHCVDVYSVYFDVVFGQYGVCALGCYVESCFADKFSLIARVGRAEFEIR